MLVVTAVENVNAGKGRESTDGGGMQCESGQSGEALNVHEGGKRTNQGHVKEHVLQEEEEQGKGPEAERSSMCWRSSRETSITAGG